MIVKTIRVGLGMTVPHPTVPYANVKPTVELEADLSDDESAEQAVKDLQEACALYVTRYCEHMLKAPFPGEAE